MTVRVLIADDQQLVRTGFAMILATHNKIDVVAEATNGHEAVKLTTSLAPDVVLMDIQMPASMASKPPNASSTTVAAHTPAS